MSLMGYFKVMILVIRKVRNVYDSIYNYFRRKFGGYMNYVFDIYCLYDRLLCIMCFVEILEYYCKFIVIIEI